MGRRLGLSAAELEARLDPLWAPGITGEATLAEIEARIGRELRSQRPTWPS